MFSRSLISIEEVLEESELFRILKNLGVELVDSSPKYFSFYSCDPSKLQTTFLTYVTSNKYTLRYLGKEFALSYSTVEENVTESKKGALGSSKTYICVLTTDTSLGLLQKLAHSFNTSIKTKDRDVSNQFIRNLVPS